MKTFLSIIVSVILVNSSFAEENDLEAKKQLVIDFYTQALFHGNVAAVDEYIGDVYIQHNPSVPDGKDAIRNFIKGLGTSVSPTGEIVRAIAEGDLVVLHVRTDSGLAIIDIFRVENCKIVEHWDVIQAVPSSSANDNTMF